MPSLRDQFVSEMNRLQGDVGTVSVQRAVELLGGGSRGKSALAQELAGTTDKRSRAYKSAQRSVNRWTTERGAQRRTPSGVNVQRIQAAGQRRELAERLRQARITVSAELEVDPSPDGTEAGMRPRDIEDAEIEDTRWIDAFEEGRDDDAAQLFGEALLDAYEPTLRESAIGNVDSLHIELS
jgi:hypothetical protein